jgi:hypothetical protein
MRNTELGDGQTLPVARSLRPWVGLFALVGALSALALGAQLPNGSYQRTCQDISLVDGTLIAQCRTADQSWRPTTLPNAAQCQSEIVNNNGKLECRAAERPKPRTSEFGDGYASFGAACENAGDPAEFLVIRLAGRSDMQVKIVFDKKYSETIHVYLPQGSLSHWACGHFPADDVQWRYSPLD